MTSSELGQNKSYSFQKKGNLAEHEKWFINSQRLEVINSYVCLGYTLTTLRGRVMVAVIAVTTDRKGERGRVMVAVIAVTTDRKGERGRVMVAVIAVSTDRKDESGVSWWPS